MCQSDLDGHSKVRMRTATLEVSYGGIRRYPDDRSFTIPHRSSDLISLYRTMGIGYNNFKLYYVFGTSAPTTT